MAKSLESDLLSGRAARTTSLPVPFEAQFYTGGVLQIIHLVASNRNANFAGRIGEHGLPNCLA